MKFLFIILCLFVFSCDSGSPTAPAIQGCTDETACNYDDTATEDDGSCTYAENNQDCDGNCLVDIDDCGICNGDDNNNDEYCLFTFFVNKKCSNSTSLTFPNFGCTNFEEPTC